MEFIQILGLLATILSIATYTPQVVQIYKTKSARDISMPMLSLLSFGVAIWLVFGIRLGDVPLIITNSLILAMSLTMMVLKFMYDRRTKTN